MAPSSPPNQSFVARNFTKLLASAVITAMIVYTLHKGGLSLVPKSGDFQQVRWLVLPAYLVVLIASTYFRAVRWRYLLRSFADVSRGRILSVSWIGFAAILIFPFRIGEFVRPMLLREKGKLSFSSATGTVVAERVVDGLFLSIVLAVALLTVPTLDPLPERVVGLPVSVASVRQSGFFMLGLFSVAFATIAVFYFAREWAHRTTLRVFGIFHPKLGAKLAALAMKLADGLHFLARGRDAAGFLFETSLYWGLNAFGMWILAWGCGVIHENGSPITFGEACSIMGMLGCTILIPGPPGLLGVFQVGIYAGMTMYFPASVVTGPGAAYVFLLYAIQIGWTLLSGVGGLIADPGALRVLASSGGAATDNPPDRDAPPAGVPNSTVAQESASP